MVFKFLRNLKLSSQIAVILMTFLPVSSFADDPLSKALALFEKNIHIARQYLVHVRSQEDQDKIFRFALGKTASQLEELRDQSIVAYSKLQQSDHADSKELLALEEEQKSYFQLQDLLCKPYLQDFNKYRDLFLKIVREEIGKPFLTSLPQPSLRVSPPIPAEAPRSVLPHEAVLAPNALFERYKEVFAKGSIQIQIESRRPELDFPVHDMKFSINFLDSSGQIKGFARLIFTQNHPFTQAPDLHVDRVILHDPALRGSGLAAKLMKANVRLLQDLSRSPLARISIKAYSGSARDYGAYVWAPYGFELDPSAPQESLAFLETDSHFEPARKFAEGFLNWLSEQYGPYGRIGRSVNRDRPELELSQLSEEEYGRIKTLARSWKYPWEMALYDTRTHLGRAVGKFVGKLGKEYLSSTTFVWDGELYVNRESESLRQFYRYADEVLGRPSQ